jgi:outer membrane biosynthesis protein TonB
MAATTGKFLTQDERDLCIKIAALNMVLVSQRAQALLLLDDGHTQAKSCELSSLTLGQLRYLLRLFKTKGMDLFPEELFPQTEEKEIEETPVPTAEAAEPEISTIDVKKEKKKKGKKKSKKKKDKKTSVKKTKKGKKEGKKKKKGKKGQKNR